MWRLSRLVSDASSDIQIALRSLSRGNLSPTLIIVLVAFAAAANIILYGLMSAVTVPRLPYGSAHELVLLWNQHKSIPLLERGIATPRDVARWRSASCCSPQMATAELWTDNASSEVDLISGESATRLRGAFISENFFDVLQIRAQIGRTFTGNDAELPVAILSHHLWQERFGSQADVIGRSILIAAGRRRTAQKTTVIGVLPTAFQFTYPEPTDIWLPQGTETRSAPPSALLFWTVARLAPGTTVERAQIEMARIAAEFAAERPKETFRQDLTVRVEPMDHYVRGEFERLIALLWAVVAASVVIALANIACLQAAATTARLPEFDARYALGAGPWRLARQLASETATLAVIGAIVGVILAFGCQQLVHQFLPIGPQVDDVRIRVATIAVCVVLAASVGLAGGFLMGPTVIGRYRRQRLTKLTAGREMSVRLATFVIVCQSLIVTTALAVSIGSMLTLFRLERVSPGFNPDGLLVTKVQLLADKYSNSERARQFYDGVVQMLRSFPGIDAAITSVFPFAGVDLVTPLPLASPATGHIAATQRRVDEHYLSLMNVPLLAGRGFTADDVSNQRRSVIVSKELATSLFNTWQVIGRSFPLDGAQDLEIIGVVPDLKQRRVDEPSLPAYYLPYTLSPSTTGFIVIRAKETNANLPAMIRSAIVSADPAQPVERIASARELIAETFAHEAFASVSTMMVSLLAWVLATAGFFGIVSWYTYQERLNTGIRLALGARRTTVVRAVVVRTLYPVIAGLCLACPVALVLQSLDFRATGLSLARPDGTGLVVASTIVLISSAIAAYVCAVSSSHVDPTMLMRPDHLKH